MSSHGADRSLEHTGSHVDRLQQHLAELIEALPLPDQPKPRYGPVDRCVWTVVSIVIDQPDTASAATLQTRSPLSQVDWTIACRVAVHRGWLKRIPSRAGQPLLIPTDAGRSAIGLNGNASATRLEGLVRRHGAHAELVASLQDRLSAMGYPIRTVGIVPFDAIVDTNGRLSAAVAIHPTRDHLPWSAMLDRIATLRASVLLLMAWPEHHDVLANAHLRAVQALATHPARLTVSVRAESIP